MAFALYRQPRRDRQRLTLRRLSLLRIRRTQEGLEALRLPHSRLRNSQSQVPAAEANGNGSKRGLWKGSGRRHMHGQPPLWTDRQQLRLAHPPAPTARAIHFSPVSTPAPTTTWPQARAAIVGAAPRWRRAAAVSTWLKERAIAGLQPAKAQGPVGVLVIAVIHTDRRRNSRLPHVSPSTPGARVQNVLFQ
jgi:hypothetical protein